MTIDWQAISDGRTVEPCLAHGFVEVDPALILKSDGSGPLELDAEAEGKDYFRLSMRKGSFGVEARSHLGLVPVNSKLALFVRSRVPLNNLAGMAAIAGVDPAWLALLRAYETETDPAIAYDIVFAQVLARRLETIRALGVHRRYEQSTHVGSQPSGRILATETVRGYLARNVRHVAVYARFDRSDDTAANQALALASDLLLERLAGQEHPEVSPARLALQRSSAFLKGVSRSTRQGFMWAPEVVDPRRLPAQRAHYRPAVELAKAIVRSAGLLHAGTSPDVPLDSMVVNGNDLFEGFVRASLDSFAKHEFGGHVRVKDGNTAGYKFFKPDSPDVKPDALVYVAGHVRLVAEVKNKPREGWSKAEDIQQALAYAVRFDCQKAVLVHPRKEGQERGWAKEAGVAGSVTVRMYRVDLASSDIDAEGELLARELIRWAIASEPDSTGGHATSEPLGEIDTDAVPAHAGGYL
jgi:5-methylcytosine-specific restriction endonuclease McrBC regulatory subunit McrC